MANENFHIGAWKRHSIKRWDPAAGEMRAQDKDRDTDVLYLQADGVGAFIDVRVARGSAISTDTDCGGGSVAGAESGDTGRLAHCLAFAGLTHREPGTSTLTWCALMDLQEMDGPKALCHTETQRLWQEAVGGRNELGSGIGGEASAVQAQGPALAHAHALALAQLPMELPPSEDVGTFTRLLPVPQADTGPYTGQGEGEGAAVPTSSVVDVARCLDLLSPELQAERADRLWLETDPAGLELEEVWDKQTQKEGPAATAAIVAALRRTATRVTLFVRVGLLWARAESTINTPGGGGGNSAVTVPVVQTQTYLCGHCTTTEGEGEVRALTYLYLVDDGLHGRKCGEEPAVLSTVHVSLSQEEGGGGSDSGGGSQALLQGGALVLPGLSEQWILLSAGAGVVASMPSAGSDNAGAGDANPGSANPGSANPGSANPEWHTGLCFLGKE